jgi:hypothetical protein
VRPKLVKEITPSEYSGRYGALNQVFMTLGICAASASPLLLYTDVKLLWWQVTYLVFMGLVIIQLLMLIFITPDSPHSYHENGKDHLAKALLRDIMENPGAVVGMQLEIYNEVRIETHSSQGIKIALRNA